MIVRSDDFNGPCLFSEKLSSFRKKYFSRYSISFPWIFSCRVSLRSRYEFYLNFSFDEHTKRTRLEGALDFFPLQHVSSGALCANFECLIVSCMEDSLRISYFISLAERAVK